MDKQQWVVSPRWTCTQAAVQEKSFLLPLLLSTPAVEVHPAASSLRVLVDTAIFKGKNRFLEDADYQQCLNGAPHGHRTSKKTNTGLFSTKRYFILRCCPSNERGKHSSRITGFLSVVTTQTLLSKQQRFVNTLSAHFLGEALQKGKDILPLCHLSLPRFSCGLQSPMLKRTDQFVLKTWDCSSKKSGLSFQVCHKHLWKSWVSPVKPNQE